MTPFEELGFKKGDLFTYKGKRKELVGKTFMLSRDDGTRFPLFKCVSFLVDTHYSRNYVFVFDKDEILPCAAVEANE